jgi:DNA-binding MarR family transcriptional regulator
MGASQLDDSAASIGELIDLATDLTVRRLSDRNDLSGSAGMLLNRVDREGPAKLTALAAAEGIGQPAMTQLIQRLQRQGLVERLGDPDDRRVALVALTELGTELLAQRTAQRRQRLSRLLATLSSEDEFALWLAAQVALPVVRQLLDNAGDRDVTAAPSKT